MLALGVRGLIRLGLVAFNIEEGGVVMRAKEEVEDRRGVRRMNVERMGDFKYNNKMRNEINRIVIGFKQIVCVCERVNKTPPSFRLRNNNFRLRLSSEVERAG